MSDAATIDLKSRASDPVLLAPHYVLGEHRRKAADIDGLSAFFEASQMIDDLALWGLDHFHSTDHSAMSLGVRSGRETLHRAGMKLEEISALLICATQLGGDTEAHAALVRCCLEGLGLDLFVAGITLGRCTSLPSGLRLADPLVRGGMHENVLVIAAERKFLADMTAAGRLRAFFRIWVRKEAILKYRGTGFAGGAASVDVLDGMIPEGLRLVDDGSDDDHVWCAVSDGTFLSVNPIDARLSVVGA